MKLEMMQKVVKVILYIAIAIGGFLLIDSYIEIKCQQHQCKCQYNRLEK